MKKNVVIALVVGGVALGYKIVNYFTDNRLMVHAERYNESVVKFYDILGKNGAIDHIENGPSFIHLTRKNSVMKNESKEES